jgi:RNA polymerase sigma factor (sigma-70 family)
MKTNSNPSGQEGEYRFYNLLSAALTGRRPIDVIFEDAEFQSRLRRICYKLEHDKDKAEDLFQETSVKVLRYASKNPTDMPETSEAFFSWLFIVARHAFLTQWQKDKPRQDDLPLEDIQLPTPGDDLDSQCFLSEFEEFCQSLSYKERRSVELWLEGYSLREIADILVREGYPYSHVAISVWRRNALKAFFNRNHIKKAIGF